MLAFLKGKLAFTEPGAVVVDVGGVGYRVFTSGSTLGRMPSPGENVKLFTRLVVKDDEMQLYGFSSRDELSLFTSLISVSGVGPKGALAILSSFTPDIFRSAVAEENAALLAKAPGVGKKTSRRIVLELKDKIGLPESPGQQQIAGVSNAGEEAVAALVSLGYRQPEARSAVAKTMDKRGKDLALEEIIKDSLKLLDSL